MIANAIMYITLPMTVLWRKEEEKKFQLTPQLSITEHSKVRLEQVLLLSSVDFFLYKNFPQLSGEGGCFVSQSYLTPAYVMKGTSGVCTASYGHGVWGGGGAETPPHGLEEICKICFIYVPRSSLATYRCP